MTTCGIARATLLNAGPGGKIGTCLMVAGSFRVTCNDARGPRAGATIAALAGRRAEKEGHPMTPAKRAPVVELTTRRLADLFARLEEIEAQPEPVLRRSAPPSKPARRLRLVKGGSDG